MDKDIFLECNLNAVKLFGCKSKREILGHGPVEFSPKKQPDGESSKKKALRYIKVALAGKPQSFYWKHKKKDGTLIDTEISLKNEIRINGYEYTQAIGKDITEKMSEEEKLRESEQKFKNIFNYSSIGVSLLSTHGVWLEVNDSLCKITGYPREELLGKKFNDITYEDDKSIGSDIVKDILLGKLNHAYLEKRYIHKDGHIIWVQLSIALVSDSNKKPLYFVAHTQDVTINKEREKKLEELSNAKLSFLSMASHQLRTPLSATKWIIESLLSDKTFTLKQQDKFLDLMISNQRLINLVNRLLNVIKIESGKLVVNKKDIDLLKLINSVVDSLEPLISKKKKKINIVYSSEEKNAFSDPALITEVFENLLSNAISYSSSDSADIEFKVIDNGKDYLISVHNG